MRVLRQLLGTTPRAEQLVSNHSESLHISRGLKPVVAAVLALITVCANRYSHIFGSSTDSAAYVSPDDYPTDISEIQGRLNSVQQQLKVIQEQEGSSDMYQDPVKEFLSERYDVLVERISFLMTALFHRVSKDGGGKPENEAAIELLYSIITELPPEYARLFITQRNALYDTMSIHNPSMLSVLLELADRSIDATLQNCDAARRALNNMEEGGPEKQEWLEMIERRIAIAQKQLTTIKVLQIEAQEQTALIAVLPSE